MSESRYFFKFSYLTLKEDILCQKEDERTWPKKEDMSSQRRTYGNPMITQKHATNQRPKFESIFWVYFPNVMLLCGKSQYFWQIFYVAAQRQQTKDGRKKFLAYKHSREQGKLPYFSFLARNHNHTNLT